MENKCQPFDSQSVIFRLFFYIKWRHFPHIPVFFIRKWRIELISLQSQNHMNQPNQNPIPLAHEMGKKSGIHKGLCPLCEVWGRAPNLPRKKYHMSNQKPHPPCPCNEQKEWDSQGAQPLVRGLGQRPNSPPGNSTTCQTKNPTPLPMKWAKRVGFTRGSAPCAGFGAAPRITPGFTQPSNF